MAQLGCLPSVQPLGNSKRRVHSNDAAIKVQLGHALKTPRRAFLDTHTAAFAVVDQDFIETIRTIGSRNARLGTNQITIVASVASAAAETPAGFRDRLLLAICLD